MIDPRYICIIHSRENSISVQVTGPDKIEVRAPAGFTQQEAIALVNKHEEAIQKLFANFGRLQELTNYEDGSRLPFFGEDLELKLVVNADFAWKLDGKLYINARHKEHLKAIIKLFYAEQAKYLLQRAGFLAELHEFRVNRLSKRWNKSRWGSCSGGGNISLNNALILTPKEVIDYVIIHELCHLQHHNHSKEFWQKVEGIVPDYRDHKAWLNEHNHRVRLFS